MPSTPSGRAAPSSPPACGWTAGRSRPPTQCGDQPFTFLFSHAVTPIAADRTRHVWRVSRNFALGEQASKILLPIFTEYYRRVQTILETMQAVLDADGPRKEVNVSADAAALQVRKIIRNMVADEGTGR